MRSIGMLAVLAMTSCAAAPAPVQPAPTVTLTLTPNQVAALDRVFQDTTAPHNLVQPLIQEIAKQIQEQQQKPNK